MFVYYLAIVVLVACGIALLPGIGVRSRIVTMLCVIVQVSLVASAIAAIACTIQPDWSPAWLNDGIQPAIDWIADQTTNDHVRTYPHLTLGLLIGILGVPVMVVLDTVRHQASVIALLRSLSRQLCARRRIDAEHSNSTPTAELLAKLNARLNED